MADEMVVEPEAPEGALLALAVIKQAMIDLGDPYERDGAVLFLTETLWSEPEGLAFRDLAPGLFTHETETRERIRLMIADEIDLPGPMRSDDGAVSYEDVLDLLLSSAREASS
jgi:hypothetical protein